MVTVALYKSVTPDIINIAMCMHMVNYFNVNVSVVIQN